MGVGRRVSARTALLSLFSRVADSLLRVVATSTWIVGFRSPKLHWDLRTTDLDVFEHTFNATEGWLRLTATSVQGLSQHSSSGSGKHVRELRLNVTAPRGSFSDPLFFPTTHGFSNKPGCVESYASTMLIGAFENGLLVEQHTILFAALEFGGAFRGTV